MPEITITASAVAWYGATMATLSLAVSGYVAFRDRPRLRIGVTPKMVRVDEMGADSPTAYLVVNVANRGRRPVTVDGVALIPKDWIRSSCATRQAGSGRRG